MAKKCKLCLKEKRIIRSHIIPEFMYKPVYDENHKFVAGQGYESEKKSNGKTYLGSIGAREHLLCAKCDNEHIGIEIESFAKPVVEDILNIENSKIISNISVDYNKFKLFQLSLIWRASVSTNQLFLNVNLGIRHQEKLRKMLLEKNPGVYYQYGCMIVKLNNLHLKRSIQQATRYRKNAHNIHIINSPGLHWVFYVSNHSNKLDEKKFFLQENGLLPITNASKDYEKETLQKLVASVQLMAKHDKGLP